MSAEKSARSGERTLLILAAGRGTRLEPLTTNLPKGLAPLHGKGLVEWQVQTARRVGLSRIVLATGYRAEALDFLRLPCARNDDYATTNMVESLWRARHLCRGEVVVSYADIVFNDVVLERLLACEAEASVVVDQDWLPYWRARSEDPLSDAESLRADPDWRLRSVGQKAATLEEIQGQYIGLTRWQPAAWDRLLACYEGARSGASPNPWPREPRRWYFTDLLQSLIDEGLPVQGVPVPGGWLEIDTPEDHELAQGVSSAKGDRLEIAAPRSP